MDWSILLNFWPLFLLQIVLLVIAFLDLRKRKSVKHLSRGAWIVVIIFLNLVGPILYFLIGRSEE